MPSTFIPLETQNCEANEMSLLSNLWTSCSLENVVSHLGLFAADETRTTRLRRFVALMWLDEGHIDLTRLAEKPRHCLRWRSDQNYMRHPLSSKQTSFDPFSSYILSPPLYSTLMFKWGRKVRWSRLHVSHINSHDQKVTNPFIHIAGKARMNWMPKSVIKGLTLPWEQAH